MSVVRNKRKKGVSYTVRFRDLHLNSTQLTFPTASRHDEAIRRIRELKECLREERSLSREIKGWIRSLGRKRQKRLADHGLLPDTILEQRKVAELIDDYITHLRSLNRAAHHVQTTESCARFSLRGIVYPHQITLVKVEKNLKRLPATLAARTHNGYIEAPKAFCKWLKRTGVLESHPLEYLEKLNEDARRTRERRPMQPDELVRLLAAAIDGEPWGERMKISGLDRYWLYRIAAETGLRANELRSLTRASFDLNAATVRVAAASVKNRRPVVLPIRQDTARELRDYLANKLPEAPALQVPRRTADMLRADLAVAGVPDTDGTRRLDFHSLRGAMEVLMRHARVDVGVRQAAMRHSDPRLTLMVYDDPTVDLRAAVEATPALTVEAVRGKHRKDTG